MIPSIGRMVHYVLSAHDKNAGQHRPAVIVNIFEKTPTAASPVQLQVFTDAANDGMHDTAWRTSVHQDPSGLAPGSWHEMERVEQPPAVAAAPAREPIQAPDMAAESPAAAS